MKTNKIICRKKIQILKKVLINFNLILIKKPVIGGIKSKLGNEYNASFTQSRPGVTRFLNIWVDQQYKDLDNGKKSGFCYCRRWHQIA